MATKHLAKQLGLIRRSSRLSVISKNGCRPRCKQFFEYLVIIDFESTCWRDAKHYGQEIIEFPAVLLNTSNGEIESEFHTYVQPQEHPILSAFCTELTGIKQQQVDEGIPLKICLSQFSSWIQKIQKEKNIFFPSAVPTHPTPEQKMCGFVTWSDWDLGVCLLYECKRKQLRKPDILNSWIDLRLTYKVFYTRKPKGLNGALQDLGIEFAGREHSGLDDSRNTAKLAWRMICDGCVMKITKSLDKVLPKTSVRTLAANGCNPGQSSASQASTNNMAKNNSLASENCCTIFGKTSSKENDPDPCAGNDPVAISKGAVKMSTVVQEIHPPQTLINGLCTTLGNSNKHRFSNRNSFTTLQTGKQIGSFSSTPIESSSVASAHVLIATTVSSVNDISALEISSNSDCLSLLADWEDAAVIEDSQQEPSDTSILQQEDPSSSSISMSKTNMENYNGLNRKIIGFKPQMTHLNSIVYKSPDTTIYNTSAKPQAFNCSTFKLPFALGNKSVNNVSNNMQQPNRSTSNTSVPKRKLSSVSFYSPPKKQPFTIHKDQGSAGNRSLPPTSNRSRVAPTGVLNSTVNMNRTIGSIKSGKITAPVCNCGRRAKRLTVTNVGPNQGKVFYSCSVKKRNEENGKGCEYFKWEQTLLKEKMAHSSALLSTSGISFTCSGVSTGQSVSHKTFIGLRPSMRT